LLLAITAQASLPLCGACCRDTQGLWERCLQLHSSMDTHHFLEHSELVSGRTPRPLVAPVLMFDLKQEAQLLRGEWPWEKHGHNARTLIKNEDACLVQISLKAGTTIQEQRVGLRLIIQVLSGELSLTVAGEKVTLSERQLLALEPNVPHSIEGRLDSELLLWISGRSAHPDAHTTHGTSLPR
jgi:quercetin dioxygenase-like cupin family protein